MSRELRLGVFFSGDSSTAMYNVLVPTRNIPTYNVTEVVSFYSGETPSVEC
jgi:hypothetical protein